MKRYLLKEIKCGVTDGGMACGPVGGSIVATIGYESEGETKYLTCLECDETPEFYLTDEDIFDGIMEDEFSDKNADIYQNSTISKFDGIELGYYEDIFPKMKDNPNVSAVLFIRYLITLVRCGYDEIDDLINMAKGKYADELDVPVSDVEEDFID